MIPSHATLFVDDEHHSDFDGPIPPVGAWVWVDAPCVVTEVKYFCNQRRGRTSGAIMGVEVFVKTIEPEVDAALDLDPPY